MKLLYKPIPYKNESPGSLLLRVCEHNGWQSVSSFLAAINPDPYYGNSTVNGILSNQKRWDGMCETIGLNTEETSRLCYKRNGVWGSSLVSFRNISIPWRKLRITEPVICPKCLSVQGYADSHWDFSLVSVCPIHQVKLINHCQKCGDKLHWNRRSISSCKCDFNLCESQTEGASPRTTNIIYDILERKDSGKINELFSLFDTYKHFFEFIESPLENYNLVRVSVLGSIKPNYLQALITKLVKKINRTNGMHPRVILYVFLVSKNKDLIKMANRIIDCLLLNTQSKHKPLKGYINTKSACAVLRISISQLAKIREANLLEGYIEKDGRSPSSLVSIYSLNNLVNKLSQIHHHFKTEYEYDLKVTQQLKLMTKINGQFDLKDLLSQLQKTNSKTQNIQTIKLSGKGYITISEAAEVCDVHYENIRFAVHCGILKRLPSEKTEGTQIFISKTSIYDFNKKYVFTKNISKKHKINPTNLAEKIISAGVNPVSGPRIDGGLTYLFCRSDLTPLDMKEIAKIKGYPTKAGRKKIKNRPLEEHFISLSSAAKALGVSPQRVAQLIRKGLLIRYTDNKRNISVTRESFIKIYELTDSCCYLTIESAAHLLRETKREFYTRYLNTKIINKIYEGVELYISSNDFYKIEQFKKKFITSKEAGDIFGASSSLLHNLRKMKEAKPAKTYFIGKNCIHFYDREKLEGYFLKKDTDRTK